MIKLENITISRAFELLRNKETQEKVYFRTRRFKYERVIDHSWSFKTNVGLENLLKVNFYEEGDI